MFTLYWCRPLLPVVAAIILVWRLFLSAEHFRSLDYQWIDYLQSVNNDKLIIRTKLVALFVIMLTNLYTCYENYKIYVSTFLYSHICLIFLQTCWTFCYLIIHFDYLGVHSTFTFKELLTMLFVHKSKYEKYITELKSRRLSSR